MVGVRNNFLDENLQNLGSSSSMGISQYLTLNTNDIGEFGSPEGKVAWPTFLMFVIVSKGDISLWI